MTTPELSAEERAVVERFEAAPDLPESHAGREALLDVLVMLYEGAWDLHWQEADHLAEMVAGKPVPADAVDIDQFRAWMSERLL